MADIATSDIRTYVTELISKEFGPATKNGHKVETGDAPEGRYPDGELTHPETCSRFEDLK